MIAHTARSLAGGLALIQDTAIELRRPG